MILSFSGVFKHFSKWTSSQKGWVGGWGSYFWVHQLPHGQEKGGAEPGTVPLLCVSVGKLSFLFKLEALSQSFKFMAYLAICHILHVWIAACFRVMQMNVIVFFFFSETCIFWIHIWVSCVKTSHQTRHWCSPNNRDIFKLKVGSGCCDPFWTGRFMLYDHLLVKHCLGEEI